jgi:hypothetical protein
MNTAGFYSYSNDELFYAPNFVQLPSGQVLLAEEHDQYTYPVDSWSWFESRRLATQALVPLQDES